ncbi:MAG: hypothetical protein MZU95_12730 [Desulfomicrobium escambiense]|nr:hypothetical protein [Desulfomicrobium escambiense]
MDTLDRFQLSGNYGNPRAMPALFSSQDFILRPGPRPDRALRSIRAGEYEFSTALAPADVLAKLIRGDIKMYRVTIPEDLSAKRNSGHS